MLAQTNSIVDLTYLKQMAHFPYANQDDNQPPCYHSYQ